MIKNSLSLLTILCLFSLSALAQSGRGQESTALSGVTLGLGGASISFVGEMNKENPIPATYINRLGFTFMAEKRFGDYLGVSLDGLIGSVTHNQRTVTPATNLNFESKINQFGLNVSFHTDNDAIFKSRSSLSPFATVGAAVTIFDPHGDLYDADGNQYYYWDNGYIMDRPQATDSLGTARQLNRDYEYETQLTDSLNDYNRNTISFPVTLGLKWKLSNTVQMRAYGTYVFTQSDFIDNYSIDNRNDKYFYAGISMNITLKAVDNRGDGRYENVDFKELVNRDSDDDGVKDIDDECPNTPVGEKVDSKGCWGPNDGDGDGVQNYIDEEQETEPGMKVDAKGVTLDPQPLPEVEEPTPAPEEGGEEKEEDQ